MGIKATTAVTAMLAALLFADIANADTRTTRRGRLTLRSGSVEEMSHDLNTEASTPDSVVISGYDKPLRSTYETFFVTNGYSAPLTSVSLSFTYRSLDGTMLHSRTATIKCLIPPHETRQLFMSAWDRQFTYYSINTRIRSRSEGAVPYITEIKPLGIEFISGNIHPDSITHEVAPLTPIDTMRRDHNDHSAPGLQTEP